MLHFFLFHDLKKKEKAITIKTFSLLQHPRILSQSGYDDIITDCLRRRSDVTLLIREGNFGPQNIGVPKRLTDCLLFFFRVLTPKCGRRHESVYRINSTVMYPQQFALISKAYTEEISLQKDGSQITREFTSECTYNEDRTFQTVGTFIPKLVPKHFVTTLTVADELVYYESIAFERRTVLKNYSETTNIFLPKEKTYKYRSSLVFQPNHVKKYYRVGTELLPAQKYDATEELNHLENGAASGCSDKCAVNGDINGYPQLINGEA